MFNHQPDGEFDKLLEGSRSDGGDSVKDCNIHLFKYANFDSKASPCTHPLFESIFTHMFSFLVKTQEMMIESGKESKLLDFVENVLSSLTMKAFVEQCEASFQSIFSCERVNFMLIDRV